MLVENFDGYTELLRPLKDRDSRVFDSGKNKVTYGAYQLAIAENTTTKNKVILVQHGGGKEVHQIESHWISAKPLLDLGATNEAALYGILFSIYQARVEGEKQAAEATKYKYIRAFIDGTLKKRKLRGSNDCKVWIDNKIKIKDAA